VTAATAAAVVVDTAHRQAGRRSATCCCLLQPPPHYACCCCARHLISHTPAHLAHPSTHTPLLSLVSNAVCQHTHTAQTHPPVEEVCLLCQAVAALLADVHQVQHSTAQVGQRGDGLHLNRVALLKGTVQDARRVQHLCVCQSVWVGRRRQGCVTRGTATHTCPAQSTPAAALRPALLLTKPCEGV
jgi:hypothetical protein